MRRRGGQPANDTFRRVASSAGMGDGEVVGFDEDLDVM
jgi:hypothetical protein